MADSLVDTVRSIIAEGKSWVVFRNGTCVIVNEPEDDPGGHAVRLMKEWGPVHPGTSHGDFNIFRAATTDGWIVTSHHKDIFTYVGRSEVEEIAASEVSVGLYGRSKRDMDARELEVVHVEEWRGR